MASGSNDCCAGPGGNDARMSYGALSFRQVPEVNVPALEYRMGPRIPDPVMVDVVGHLDGRKHLSRRGVQRVDEGTFPAVEGILAFGSFDHGPPVPEHRLSVCRDGDVIPAGFRDDPVPVARFPSQGIRLCSCMRQQEDTRQHECVLH